ncbi:hypothetical protein GFD21_06080 [Bifidobacterium sp. SMA15]|uniref:SpaA-like prealbumin fold domain-containing protein n=2 Tax=Bifidobacterium platyrrhinorum TaxID=2661628 RepID=A0A6L9SUY0_9BIFI|nr:hypothetical protein [Bifidobacterium platyrrhinorum]
MAERIRIVIWAVLAVIVAVAMLFVCSTPAMAENTAAGVTQTGGNDANGNAAGAGNSGSDKSGDTGSSSGDASTGGSGSSSDSNPDTSSNGNASGESTGSDSDTAQSDDAADKGASGNAQSDGAKAAADDAATQFIADLKDPCDTGQTARTITVTSDITLTTTGIHPQCNITVVSDGNPHTITWGGSGSVLWIDPNRSFTIGSSTDSKANNLTFTNNGNAKDNPSNAENPLFHNYGTVTIDGGTFKDSAAANGSVVLNAKTLTINGGTFINNKATGVGGGVVYQNVENEHKTPATTVTGGTFSYNRQDPGTCDTDATADVCEQEAFGGGAIHTASGELTIKGNVTFDHNSAKSWGFRSGGGAVWAQGKLWVKNSTDGTGSPSFTNNWASVAEPGKDILRGGAGGAIFLNGEGSLAYLMGGKFENNASGYLGGAIYTEEDSTTYVGKSVAYANIAGHFGGGLWFCPSGASVSSKSGNIALFDNSVEDTIDANTSNAKDGKKPDAETMAGDDFAIMNPWFKWEHYNRAMPPNYFQLLSSWFTSRASAAVDWYWDGTPKKESSGYYDSWLPYQTVRQDRGAVLTDTSATKRYKDADEQTRENQRIKYASTVLCLYADDGQKATCNNKAKENSWDNPEYIGTGVALKAIPKSDAVKDNAKRNASLTLTGNRARLSGGAFGSNGVISFSSPYSATWKKAEGADGTTDEAKLRPGSEWTLSTTDGGPMNEDFRPADCQVNDGATTTGGSCWQTGADGKKTVVIRDNGGRDNNSDDGVISVDNLAVGTYELTELTPPPGYEKTENTYTFTIEAVTPGQAPKEPQLMVKKADGSTSPVNGNVIGNKLTTGSVSWQKIGDGETTQSLGGSHWKVMDAEGKKVIDGFSDIQDCDTTSTDAKACDGKIDTDPATGRFTIKGLPTGAEKTTYRLVETQAPEGYILPANTYYEFTLDKDGNVAWIGLTIAQFKNTPLKLSWDKVDSSKDHNRIEGSEWSITAGTWNESTKTFTPGNDAKAMSVVDCSTSECASKPSGTESYTDVDQEPGQISITAIKAGTYRLVETKAPKGYQLPNANDTFAIVTVTADGGVHMDRYGEWSQATDGGSSTCVVSNGVQTTAAEAGCQLTNHVIPISALPFTGGVDARDWLLFGGIAAVAAAITLALINEYRKRKGLA